MEALSRRCTVCGDLEDFGAVIPLDGLRENTSQCEACSLLYDTVKGHEEIQFAESLETLVDLSLFVFLRDKAGTRLGTFELYTGKGQPVKWKKIGAGRAISEDSSSDECISLARQWLKDCQKRHPACRRPSRPRLPTRVVDVGAGPDTPRLCITGGIRGDYAALSHCWGGSDPLVTTGATLEARKQRLDLAASSKTFRDAADAARRLGLRFLWIDSLCIVQDSKEDWAREAGRMSEVYNNATVTLSADAAPDSAYGLYPRRGDRAALQETRRMPTREPGGADGNPVYVRRHAGDPFATGGCAHGKSESVPPRLKTRGWVLQEELLSPRILHFRREELSWVCSACTRCECRVRPGLPIPHPFRGAMRDDGPHEEVSRRTALHMSWPDIVEGFTRRDLTVASDRLAALSGLAGWMERETGDDYFAGLWGADLAFQLLWHGAHDPAGPGAQPPARLGHAYAPSWSWASITGPVGYYRHGGQEGGAGAADPLLKVLGLWAKTDGPNRFGPVAAAPLRLAARVLPVRWAAAPRRWEPVVRGQVGDLDPSYLRVAMDVPAEAPGDDQAAAGRRGYALVLAGRWRAAGGLTATADEAVCLLVRRPTTDEELGRASEAARAAQTPTSVHSTYLRVGLVRGAGSVPGWELKVAETVIHML